jgi:peptidoglycan/xylan/chitin deacetylase (PgdA/CDA1 family)
MKKTIKKIFFSCLRIFGTGLKNRASILMYHSVGNNGAFFTVTPGNFERQLAEIKKRKLKTIKLGELVDLLKKKEDISNTVCITFDDGYRDNLEIALPILEKYQIPASFFIATGFVSNDFSTSDGVTLPIMSEEEIRKLAAHPLAEVLPHGHSHQKMSEIATEEAVADAERSFSELSRLIGKTRRILAYPKGRFTSELAKRLAAAGWEAAVTVSEGLVSVSGDACTLKRNSINRTTEMAQFKCLVSRSVEWYLALKDIFR